MFAASLALAGFAAMGTGRAYADQTAGFTDGNTITISVTADGTQPFTYQWKKDGSNLADGGNIAGATTSTLTISNASAADEGNYSVVVTNSAGSTASDIAILTYATIAPAITMQPSSKVASPGDTITFTVAAFGAPTPTFQWRKNGTNLTNGGSISGADTASLTLINITAADAATYSVVATNSAGSDTSVNATLTVNTGTAPAITTQPASQTANLGATVTFTVTASGAPSPTFQWRKNGVNLTDGGNISGATSGTLTLTNLIAADAATYTVVATNLNGSATSNGADLTVILPATVPAITTQPADQNATPGTMVTFTVVASGAPAPTFQWRKNGVNLANGGNVSGATSDTLMLGNITAADGATYSVVATNVAGSATSANAVLTVSIPGVAPIITTQPAGQNVSPGASVSFTVAASGTPAPTFQWRKNGVNLTDGGNVSGTATATLTLNNVTSADEAAYSVVATNSSGSATSADAMLTVSIPGVAPIITTQPAGQNVSPGASVSFTVAASGTPAPTFQWRKNGVNLTDSGNVSGTTTATLTLNSVTAADGAAYSVVATNSSGSATSAGAVLTVSIPTVPPVILAHPASQTVNPGTSVSFTVVASGTPAPTFQWRKNGGNLTDGGNVSGAMTDTLTLINVTAADAGDYTVVASSVAGAATSNPATLTVNSDVAPVITLHPTTQTVVVGNSAVFTVTASGAPSPTFQWRKNGVNLTAGGNVSGATSDTLVLSSITTADAAIYTAVATNVAGSATSNGATLTVSTGTAPVITSQPASRIVNQGTTVTFTVAASGTPAPTFQWRKNGVNLTDGGNVSGATSTSLVLTSVTNADAATYSAVATNLNGTATSNGATLALSGLPVITLNPVSQTAVVGDTVTFTVAATGTPAPSFQWRQTGRNLVNSKVVFGATGSTLSLVNVPLSYAGTYTALAINLAGTVSSSGATLTIYAPPFIGTLPPTQVALAGGDIPLNVVVDGFPAPTIQWQKNGVILTDGGRVSGSTSSTLLLSAATPADSGVYTVFATNLLGTVSTQVELLILPDSVGYQVASSGHEVALSYSGAKGALQWQVSSDGGGTWTSLVNNGTYSGVTGDTLRIGGASAALSFNLYRLVSTVDGISTTVYEVMLDVADELLPSPVAVSADGNGNLYVTDTATDSVKKIVSGTQIFTFAGTDGESGSTDGTGSAARFKDPSGVAVASNGTVTVADTANATIRSITSGAVVTTLAGSAGVTGSSDGTGSSASFSSPTGIVRDAAGNFYVADSQNHIIRKITPAGSVTTFAGRAGLAGDTDGTGTAARFNRPTGIAIDSAGNLYVADTGSHLIRKVTPGGLVTTLAGQSGASGTSDGTGSAAKFNQPTGLAVDQSGNVFVADTGNSTVRRITPAGAVTTFAGAAGTAGLKDGVGTEAWFNHPLGLAFDTDGTLYVADTGNGIMRRIASNAAVRSMALYPPATTGSTGTPTPPSTPSSPTETPSTPSSPSTPSTPTTPTETPTTPSAPSTPSTPSAPSTTPTTPSTPSTPSTPTAPTPTPTGSGGGGGGAPSVWFLGGLAVLWLLQRVRSRR